MSDVCPSVPRRRQFVVSACALLMILLATPATAFAQGGAEKRWGVNVAFGPTWKADADLQEALLWGPGTEEWPPHEGSEFTVGFVRGTSRGGQLGVSFVRKPIKDREFTTEFFETSCSGPGNQFCQTTDATGTTISSAVLVNGVEVHFLIPVHTFADRVQVGVNVGGGIGFSEGTQTQSGGFTFTSTQPGQPPAVTTETFFDEGEAAGNIIGTVVPLFKVEFQAGLFVAPGLRVNISVGVNAPAPVGVRIGATYLFGSR